MTLLEARLRAACPGRDLDLLNFGIGGTGVADYRTIATLGLATYDPDLVLVHFYAGNDGPDLYRPAHERSRGPASSAPRASGRSGGTRSGSGAGVARPRRRPGAAAGPVAAGRTPRGGTPVDPSRHVSERDPALTGPIFTEAAFGAIQAEELRRLYRPADPAVADRAWQPVLADLEAIRVEVLRRAAAWRWLSTPRRSRSTPAQRAALVETLRRRPQGIALSHDALDPVASQPAARRLLPAHGPPVRRPHAGLRGSEPRLGRPLYKHQDAHWTIRGNRVAAEAEARFLAGLVCRIAGGRRPLTGDGGRSRLHRPVGLCESHSPVPSGRGRKPIRRPVPPGERLHEAADGSRRFLDLRILRVVSSALAPPGDGGTPCGTGWSRRSRTNARTIWRLTCEGSRAASEHARQHERPVLRERIWEMSART